MGSDFDGHASLRARLIDNLLELLTTPTEVPFGQHEIQPGDARIAAAVSDVVLPMVERLEPDDVQRHPAGDLLVRFGPVRDDGLLVQSYIVSQHGNLMDQPHGAVLEDGGAGGPIAYGQGANQNKGPMAAALTALAMRPHSLRKPVYLAVNTEGRSSHDGSRRIIDDLGARAAAAVLAFATDLKISLGNRGRVDVHILIAGSSCHSSQPALGINPLARSADVIAALRKAELPPAHPQLGPATATPYQLSFTPIAPHTIPAQGKLLVDRRLLPGEDPKVAVDALRAELTNTLDYRVEVTSGATMLPAEVSSDHPIVLSLQHYLERNASAGGTMFSRNTFDAGYGCTIGIPTVMFGPGRRSFGKDVVAAEAVPIDDCWTAAQALAGAISDFCA